MCGICGLIDYNRNTGIDENLLRKMCREIRHRGPDDEGVYVKNDTVSVGLGHKRLSIIDLTLAGHQPMVNENESIRIIFNGEVYNYKELRKGLEEKGHIFKSNTDTETVLHLYEQYGKDCVSFLRGMFAFAIWDGVTQSLMLARDRVGKKPLLYYYRNRVFVFASEFTALLASGLIRKDINYAAADDYFTFGYISAPLTIYADVSKLLPGHILILKDQKVTIERYWELEYQKKLVISENDAVAEIIRLLKESVQIRLQSDVPLGAFLSGGIDSSTVVALMSELSDKKVKTFSIGFNEANYNELHFAKKIAERYDTEHHELIVKPKAMEIIPLLVERYGEPYADSSCIPSYYVAKETRQYVTVALNGDGGDESFAGYERYQAMLFSRTYRNLPNLFKKSVDSIVRRLPDSINQKNKLKRLKRFFKGADLQPAECYLRWVNIFDTELKSRLYSEVFSAKSAGGDPVKYLEPYFNHGLSMIDSLLRMDVNTYLPYDLLVKMDIASMANSLEARSPFLDHKLMEFVARLPAEFKIKDCVKKYLLKKAARKLLPRENIVRSKMGFGIPVGEWFRNELKDLLIDTLLSKRSLKRNYFRQDVLKEMVDLHISRRKDYSFQLWSLLMFNLWHDRFID